MLLARLYATSLPFCLLECEALSYSNLDPVNIVSGFVVECTHQNSCHCSCNKTKHFHFAVPGLQQLTVGYLARFDPGQTAGRLVSVLILGFVVLNIMRAGKV